MVREAQIGSSENNPLEEVNSQSILTDDLLTKSKGTWGIVWENEGLFYGVGPSQAVEKTDASEALQAILGTSHPRQGMEIAVTEGRFQMPQTVTVGDGQTLSGEGIGATSLYLPDNTNINPGEGIIEFNNDSDNTAFFAGVYDMEIDGNQDSNLSGRGIVHNPEGSGAVKDFQLGRVMVFNCAEEGLFFDEKAWGYKLSDFITEGNGGNGLFLNGEQWYIDGCFAAYNGADGVEIGGDHGQLSRVNSRGNGTHGIELTTAAQYDRVTSSLAFENDNIGFWVRGLHHTISNCIGHNNGQDLSRPAFSVDGNENTIVGCIGIDTQSTPTQRSGIELVGDNNTVLGGVYLGNADQDIRVNGTENTLWGVEFQTLTDNGTRTVINGKSTNAGDPSAGSGQWAGFSDVAYNMGADVIDTTAEGDKYTPLPPSATNDWIRHTGTAV